MTTRITSLALAAALATGIATGAQAAQGEIDKASYDSGAVPAFTAIAADASDIRQVGEKVAYTNPNAAYGVHDRGAPTLAIWVGEKNHRGRSGALRADQFAATPAR